MYENKLFSLRDPKNCFEMSLNDLPGAKIRLPGIVPGLSDLAHGKSKTIGALLVLIAVMRLTEAGLDVLKYQNIIYLQSQN